MKSPMKLVLNILATPILWGICLSPLWGFYWIWSVAEPSTFWERFALIAIGLVIGGWIQIWGIALAILGTVAIWKD